MKRNLIILVAVMFLGVLFYVFTLSDEKNNHALDTTETSIITLSPDKKTIVQGDKTLLSIDDDAIFHFFKTKSQLCDPSNINSNAARKMFCENKASFRNETRFKSIVESPDKKKIGFTIESDTLSPDTVAGIFYPYKATSTVYILSNYYLGNEFLSFSPSSTNFVYKGGCFEAKCAFFIKDVETLQDEINFISKEVDARGNYVFIRWISDTEFEYTQDKVMKRASLISSRNDEGKIVVGNVTGHVNIGPFCPVQREGEVCAVPPEAYTSRSVIIYGADAITVKQKIKLDAKGNYKIPLNPGTYFLQIDPAGIGPGEKKKAVVTSSKTTIIDFDIDTGIR